MAAKSAQTGAGTSSRQSQTAVIVTLGTQPLGYEDSDKSRSGGCEEWAALL